MLSVAAHVQPPRSERNAVRADRADRARRHGRGAAGAEDAGGGARRLAVLKRIWPELATDPDFVTMFLDEARLSLRLNHANVVQTYEVLAGDDELAIAMEYLDGQPLTRVLNRCCADRGELSAAAAAAHPRPSVLAGLEHAHTLADLDGTPLGVVHRDVSPQNVFVTYDGQVKLVDFGVAKTLAAVAPDAPGRAEGEARVHGARAAAARRPSIGAPTSSRSA